MSKPLIGITYQDEEGTLVGSVVSARPVNEGFETLGYEFTTDIGRKLYWCLQGTPCFEPIR